MIAKFIKIKPEGGRQKLRTLIFFRKKRKRKEEKIKLGLRYGCYEFQEKNILNIKFYIYIYKINGYIFFKI